MDEFYEKKGILCHRFLDDINIHAEDRNKAKTILTGLNQILRNKGLTINTSKTYILQGKEVEEHFLFTIMDEIEALLKDIRKNGDSSQLKQRRRDIYRRLLKKNRVNSSIFKRLLTAYIQTRDSSLFNETLKYMELYPDLTDKFCQYYKSLKNSKHVASSLLDFLADNDRNIFPSQEQAIIECLLHVNIKSQDLWRKITHFARAKVHDKCCDYYSRSLYALFVYKYGGREEIRAVVDCYLQGTTEEAILKKYLALCATRLADENDLSEVVEHLKREANPELTELGVFVDEVKKSDSIKDLLKHISLKAFNFGKDRLLVLDVRDVMLLNILKYNREGSNVQMLESAVNRYKTKINCKRTQQLLDEIIARL